MTIPIYDSSAGSITEEPIGENNIAIFRKEWADLSLKGHHPEKDGIPACLLAAEAVAAHGASLTNSRRISQDSSVSSNR